MPPYFKTNQCYTKWKGTAILIKKIFFKMMAHGFLSNQNYQTPFSQSESHHQYLQKQNVLNGQILHCAQILAIPASNAAILHKPEAVLSVHTNWHSPQILNRTIQPRVEVSMF